MLAVRVVERVPIIGVGLYTHRRSARSGPVRRVALAPRVAPGRGPTPTPRGITSQAVLVPKIWGL